RPGHLLLIQSLQRAFRGIGARLLPFMGGEPLREWAICAMHAVSDRNMQALQHQLPVLLETCDARVLDQFAPRPQEQVAPEAPHAQECILGAPGSTSAQDDAPEALTSVETHAPDNPLSVTGQAAAFEGGSCIETRGSSDQLFATEQDGGLEAISCVEERGIGFHVQAHAAPVAAPRALGQAVSMEPDSEIPINSRGRPHGATCDAACLISGDPDPPVR
ncbi:GntR family transcriptional regulator, partial [Corallococcus sp. 4LFB]